VEHSAPATASDADPTQTPTGERPASAVRVSSGATPAGDVPTTGKPPPASGEAPPASGAPAPGDGTTAETTPTPSGSTPSDSPGFSERGRMRRRARFLRKARELAYRDLGGLVYNLHHFAQRNDALVLAKLSTLGQIDAELRTLEGALAEHQPVTVLRDAGIAACPRCAAIHGSEDRFCPNCGLAMDRRAERPVAGPPTNVAPAPAAISAPAPAPASAPSPAPAQSPAPARAAAPTAAASTPAASTPADPAPRGAPPPARGTSPPASPAPADYTTIDRPAPSRAPQTPAPASPTPASPSAPASPAPGAASPAEPTDQDQPTVIVRPPGPDA
jgi:hypothetical protein